MLSRNLSVAVVSGLVFGISGVSHAQVGGCTALTLVSTEDGSGLETRVAVDDGWVLVAPPSSGPVRLYDAHDPERPILRSSVTLGGSIHAMSIDGLIAAFSIEDSISHGNLVIYDWTDPSMPVFAARINWPEFDGVISTKVYGDRIFVSDLHNLIEFDISDPYNPQETASFPLEAGTSIDIQNGHAFVTSFFSTMQGLYILDVGTPGQIVQRGHLSVPGYIMDQVSLGDGFACVRMGFSQIMAIDISDLSHPAIASIVTSPESIVAIGARFNALYVGEGDTGGLHVYDLSEPSNPQWIQMFDPPTEPWDVEAMQGVVAVADRHSGVRLFQMSDCSGCRPDLAEPAGVLDFFDVQAFLSAFMTEGRAADLDVNAVWDVRDVLLYLEAFSAGCP